MKTDKIKFAIDDIVCVSNDFGFNPASRVLTIGKITSIHIYRGKGIIVGHDETGMVRYSVEGINVSLHEKELTLLADMK